VKPDLSIIIPAYNEAKLITQGLASMREHLAGMKFEVIVVDNGSSDDTAQVVAAQFPGFRVLSIPKSTISTARNRGAALASGRMFAFLDADVMVTPIWAETLQRKLAALPEGGDYFGGFPFDIPETGASLIERAWFVASSLGRPSYVGSANLVVSASVFHRIQGFNEALKTAEDVDFGHRAVRSGQRIDFDPGFHAIHLGFPRTLRHFVKREMWHGMGSFSSWRQFLNSKVSIAAAIFGLLVIATVLSLAVGHISAGLGLLAVSLAMPLLYVIYRLRFRNSRYLPMQYFLGSVYLGARALCGVRSLFKLSTTGHRSS
jgi:glycosyltransferase involved in cell wall biosynthesis